MRTDIVIRMQASSDSEKGQHSKAMKVAAAIHGVESVTLAGEGRNLLRVVGEDLDSNDLISRLRRKVGRADIVELRTLQAGGGYLSAHAGSLGDSAGYGQYTNYPAASYPPAAADRYNSYQKPSYEYYPPPAPYPTTVVLQHQQYPTEDPTGCSIM